MDFKLTKEQELIKKTAREFAEKRLAPINEEIEANHAVPLEIFREMGALGLMAVPFSEEFGGSDAGFDGYVLMMEEIARICSSVSMAVMTHNLAMAIIDTFGTQEQRQIHLPSGVSGESIFSFAFTEPGTGSDPKQITASAKKDADGWILNGTKRFITNANYPGILGCVFRDEESGRLVTFLIDKQAAGYSWSKPWEKMAIQGGQLLDLYFNDCRVADADMLGQVGDGFHQLEAGIGYGKMGIASLSVGISQAAYEASLEYATQKMHRGQPIIKFQAIQMLIAQMAVKLEASRLMLYKCAFEANWTSKKSPIKFAKDAAMAKTFCSNTAVDITRLAMDLHGSYGLMKDYTIEKLYREAIMPPQIEGVSHMQEIIIANAILAGY